MKIKYTGMELKLHRHGIRIALASVFGAMLIATPLVGDSALANGIVMGKVFWFHLSMALMAIGTIGFGRKKRISFSLPDGCCSSLPESHSRRMTGSSVPNRGTAFGGS